MMDANVRRKLVGLLGRLGSNNDNEILAAVRLIERARIAGGWQWDQVIGSSDQQNRTQDRSSDFNRAETPPKRSTVVSAFGSCEAFAQMLDAALKKYADERELDFLLSLGERLKDYEHRMVLSAKQEKWFRDIAGR